jgi:translation initiation factor IF-1
LRSSYLRDSLRCGTLIAKLRLEKDEAGERKTYLSKDDLIDMQGTVVAVHSGGLYRVQCDAGHEVLAQLSGRMRRFRIKVVPGDRVTVGVSPYDPVRGIITFRAR